MTCQMRPSRRLTFLKLFLDGLQPLPLLADHPVHLLVQQLDQVSDVGLGEDVGPNLIDDELLEGLGVEPGGLAGAAAPLEEGVADIVGVLTALGLGSGECLAADLVLERAAEQVGVWEPGGDSSSFWARGTSAPPWRFAAGGVGGRRGFWVHTLSSQVYGMYLNDIMHDIVQILR